MLKAAVLAPIPSPKMRTTAVANSGFRRSHRIAQRKSRIMVTNYYDALFWAD